MTITGMTRFVQQNYKVQNSHLTHKLPNGSLPPKEHVNPYCPEGMDITGRTDFRRIVPVDEGVANKIKSLVFESMEKNCGMSDGEIESENSKNNDGTCSYVFFRFRNAGKRKCHKHCGSAE